MTIILYDIPTSKGGPFNPNAWKTRYCLNYKGLVHKTEWVEKPDIEAHHIKLGIPPTSKKAADGSPFYSIPAIYDPKTGKYVADSFKIAQYLDEAYPDTPRIIPSNTTALQLAFADTFPQVTSSMLPFIVPTAGQLYSARSAPSVRANIERMFGKKLEEITPQGEAAVAEWAKFKVDLGKVDSWYAASSGLFLCGDEPSWADFLIFSFLMWPRVALGEDSQQWKDISSWHDGRWKRLADGLRKYEGVF